MQALHRARRPLPAADLAEELGVPLRTVHRDVAALLAQGMPIEGEAGSGYALRPGSFLPPLMFGEDEVDALILGLCLVSRRGDPDLGQAADDALARIAAVLPPSAEGAAALVGSTPATPGRPGETPHLAVIDQAISAEEKLRLRYTDKKGTASERTIWPVALGFFETAEVLAAWCETRRDFRHFRLDRIKSVQPAGLRYPKRRRILLAEWRAGQDMDEMG